MDKLFPRSVFHALRQAETCLIELDNRPNDAGPHPIDEYQLACRLSYFLWSSMPDDELLALAAKKQLAANLDAQVRRMLKDPKAKALTANFAGQWLQTRTLRTFTPDPKLFPSFTQKLRRAMLKETDLYFESVVRDDRSVGDAIIPSSSAIARPTRFWP